jgi:hypothetical protein
MRDTEVSQLVLQTCADVTVRTEARNSSEPQKNFAFGTSRTNEIIARICSLRYNTELNCLLTPW